MVGLTSSDLVVIYQLVGGRCTHLYICIYIYIVYIHIYMNLVDFVWNISRQLVHLFAERMVFHFSFSDVDWIWPIMNLAHLLRHQWLGIDLGELNKICTNLFGKRQMVNRWFFNIELGACWSYSDRSCWGRESSLPWLLTNPDAPWMVHLPMYIHVYKYSGVVLRRVNIVTCIIDGISGPEYSQGFFRASKYISIHEKKLGYYYEILFV